MSNRAMSVWKINCYLVLALQKHILVFSHLQHRCLIPILWEFNDSRVGPGGLVGYFRAMRIYVWSVWSMHTKYGNMWIRISHMLLSLTKAYRGHKGTKHSVTKIMWYLKCLFCVILVENFSWLHTMISLTNSR